MFSSNNSPIAVPTATQCITQLCDADNRHPMASIVTLDQMIQLMLLAAFDNLPTQPDERIANYDN